jgi:predicted neuraminidase
MGWLAALGMSLAAGGVFAQHPGLVRAEFIFETAPFPQCHASTIVETPDGLVAAWFGGTAERDPDVGIWVSRDTGSGWTSPVEVADGVQHRDKRYPTWNPVLFLPEDGPLLLFYKAGPSPDAWWGMLTTSDDQGRTWAQPRRLPEDILGPVKNKPIELPGGDLLCPSSSEHDGWRAHFERTSDLGRTWVHSGPINDGTTFSAIQPTLLVHGDERLQALFRSRQGNIVESWSDDGGRTWSALAATTLPNPNAGFDAVTLADGRHLLVYNHTTITEGEWGGPRSPLNVAVSDDGRTWQAAVVLEDEPGEYSYPAVIQSDDGLVHVTYTWKRTRIKHVVLDPAKLHLRPMQDGAWPE